MYNKLHSIGKKEKTKIILVLGVGRSGSTWISNTLAKSHDITDFYEEPLYYSKYPVILNDFSYQEHTAIELNCNLKYKDRLRNYIESLAYTDTPSKIILDDGVDITYLKRGNKNTVLIKEVHALLGFEALFKTSSVQAVLIIRDFITHVDSIMAYVGEHSSLLVTEFKCLVNENFLFRIGSINVDEIKAIHDSIDKGFNGRERSILIKLFVVFIMSKYFNQLHREYSNVMLLDYDVLVDEPASGFENICKFLNLECKSDAHIFKGRAHITRTKEQIMDRKLKYLSSSDVDLINEYITKLEDAFNE